MQTLAEEFFNTPVPLSAGVESIFSLGTKIFFALGGYAMCILKCLYFLKEINNFLFSTLVACIICFKYWFCTVT